MTGLTRTERIALFNDGFRKSPSPSTGVIVLTPGVTALGEDGVAVILRAVIGFDDFTPENDPYGAHDFGCVEHEGERYFWKIDAYDLDRKYGSADPSDPAITRRVMTIMRADEY